MYKADNIGKQNLILLNKFKRDIIIKNCVQNELFRREIYNTCL